MNRLIVFIIWLVLIALTAISPLWGEPSLFLDQVLLGNLDPTQWFIFISLGFFPLYFFVFARNEKQPLWRSLLYLLGMAFGAFILLPLEALNSKSANPLTRLQIFLLASMDVILLLILTWSMFFGDWSVYIQSYQTDLFVYIMTWDFIAIVIVSSYKVISQSNIYFKTILKQE
ncbi:MAG: hypothetical protein KGZ51_06225 [Erysipelothrix sp.]|jgi:hypothetical protein|nr:hypothetical protein [Erysipelothrix sp.]